jgi:hypothetical protein
MQFDSLDKFAAYMAGMSAAVEVTNINTLERACQIIEAEAKRVIGTYDYGWPELADATKADRVRQGYAENEPLLRSGAMRDSIETVIIIPGVSAAVGSDDPIAADQEYGTATIPPRPFLGGAVEHKRDEIDQMVGDAIDQVMATGMAARLILSALP